MYFLDCSERNPFGNYGCRDLSKAKWPLKEINLGKAIWTEDIAN